MAKHKSKKKKGNKVWEFTLQETVWTHGHIRVTKYVPKKIIVLAKTLDGAMELMTDVRPILCVSKRG